MLERIHCPFCGSLVLSRRFSNIWPLSVVIQVFKGRARIVTTRYELDNEDKKLLIIQLSRVARQFGYDLSPLKEEIAKPKLDVNAIAKLLVDHLPKIDVNIYPKIGR